MTYNVQLSVIVRGSGFWGGNMEFVKVENGRKIQFTPIGGSPDAPLYVLTDNAVYHVYCNGFLYRTITINGMILPDRSYSRVDGRQRPDDQHTISGAINSSHTFQRCLNYPFMADEDYPVFMISYAAITGGGFSFDDLSLQNAVKLSQNKASGSTYYIYITPNDFSSPVVVYCKDVISFVGNYTQQRRRR